MILMRILYKNKVTSMINCHLKQGFKMLVYWYQYPLWCLLYGFIVQLQTPPPPNLAKNSYHLNKFLINCKKLWGGGKKKKLLVILLCPPLHSHVPATFAIVSLHP